jgi:hypothetical protein
MQLRCPLEAAQRGACCLAQAIAGTCCSPTARSGTWRSLLRLHHMGQQQAEEDCRSCAAMVPPLLLRALPPVLRLWLKVMGCVPKAWGLVPLSTALPQLRLLLALWAKDWALVVASGLLLLPLLLLLALLLLLLLLPPLGP